mmetsp:Transcript_6915/g.9938  ORF Transcript_6915/g.9938 Transcript_6915/m.9938 type:complete len:285 (-) Transcript_6915:421-1275(-)|eukprot:CAMPEP_0184868652 /NCGR_PEP_ID=MMETSP0580-20130426/31228_1 /TAXON_ID=1118495 /ORGANISM="Dactyliosolen fragilissimus" /LENGTH=284 /DNA_ID=CAMNT_0027369679 /DNA_START=54 /DNA_END=908 /DNA_ORIENTATION=+
MTAENETDTSTMPRRMGNFWHRWTNNENNDEEESHVGSTQSNVNTNNAEQNISSNYNPNEEVDEGMQFSRLYYCVLMACIISTLWIAPPFVLALAGLIGLLIIVCRLVGIHRMINWEKYNNKRRLRIVNKSLVTKKAKQSITASSNDDTTNLDETQESPSQCPICIEEFQKGDKVSWGRNMRSCRHVYHTECITEWLRLHNECPCCRMAMITDDLHFNGRDETEAEQDDRDRGSNHSFGASSSDAINGVDAENQNVSGDEENQVQREDGEFYITGGLRFTSDGE